MSLRSWGSAYTREGRFSPIGVAFHWSMAALIIFQLGLGWFLSLMPVGGDKLMAYLLHGTIGVVIFLLTFLRLVWRIVIPDPFNAADKEGWKTTVAYYVEHLFYVCFLVLPLTGWAMWSALSPPGEIHVLVTWPAMPFYSLDTGLRWEILNLAEDFHFAFVWLLMVMIPLHVGAALKHHFWDRSDVLTAMLPQVPDVDPPQEETKRKRRPPKSPAA